VLMSKKSFDKLNKQQQAVLVKAGTDAQAYYESKAESINAKTVDLFKEHKVSVVTLTDAQYDAWVDMARKSAYAKFAKDVPDGQKLIDEALAVK
jgi:TRAP-type transport system periplasmic protein